jgi:hypothetical protein
LGFRVQGSRFTVSVYSLLLRLRVEVLGLGSRYGGSDFKVEDQRLRVKGSGLRV